MSHILVATDFSEVAENALHYACQFARDFNLPVTVLHSFIIPVTFSDTPMPVMPADEGRQIAEQRIGDLVSGFQATYSEVAISKKVMFGDIVDCLEEYIEDAQPSLIILGNSGTSDATLWLGSNVLSALKHLPQTVAAIPQDCTYKKPEKICFACDFTHIVKHMPADHVNGIMKLTGARLHVLNIDFHNRHFSTETPLESTEIHQLLSGLNPVYHYVEKENVEEGIREFIEANQMDWLIIVPHKYSFFEGLFHKSHTKAIMKMVHIPLVAMPEK